MCHALRTTKFSQSHQKNLLRSNQEDKGIEDLKDRLLQTKYAKSEIRKCEMVDLELIQSDFLLGSLFEVNCVYSIYKYYDWSRKRTVLIAVY